MTDNDDDQFRETNLWPFSMLPKQVSQELVRRQRTTQPSQIGVQVFDTVVLSYEAGSKLIEAGWPGIELMPKKFRLAIMGAAAQDVGPMAEQWVEEHRAELADEFTKRLTTNAVDELATRAMAESIDAYRRGHHLSVVRTLMPEVERFGRMVRQHNGTKSSNQKQAITAIKEYLGTIPVSHFDPFQSPTI